MRRQSREVALQILFQLEFAPQISFSELHSLFEKNIEKSSLDYTDVLVQGVQAKKSAIDEHIQKASRHWKIERMASVDRSILRLATFEMLYAKEAVEPKIVINEAIEIAKSYGTEESASFVNGILDQILRNDRSQ